MIFGRSYCITGVVIDVDWMTTMTKLQLGHDLKLQQYTSNDGCGVGRGNVLQCNYCVILHIPAVR